MAGLLDEDILKIAGGHNFGSLLSADIQRLHNIGGLSSAYIQG